MIDVKFQPHQMMVDYPGRVLRCVPTTQLHVDSTKPPKPSNLYHEKLVDNYAFQRVTAELAAILKAFDTFECDADIAVKVENGHKTIVGRIQYFNEHTAPVVGIAIEDVENKADEIARRWPVGLVTVVYTRSTEMFTIT